MNAMRLKTKELLRFQSGCHGNWVTIATRYVVDVYCLKEPQMPNLKSVRLKTKELLRFHSGCHGMKIRLVSNQNVASAARDLVPTSKKPLSFTNCKVLQKHEIIA